MKQKLLQSNGRIIRKNGFAFKILATELGGKVLAEVRGPSGERYDLVNGRSAVVRDFRNRISLNLVS